MVIAVFKLSTMPTSLLVGHVEQPPKGSVGSLPPFSEGTACPAAERTCLSHRVQS